MNDSAKDTLPVLFSPDHPYKDFEPVMGVWALRNLRSGKVLLGVSLHTASAINKTVFTLRLGSHRNADLQRDWHEHGEDAFATEVLHTLDRRPDRTAADYSRELAELERLWLDELQPYAPTGYHPAPRPTHPPAAVPARTRVD